MIPFSYSEKEGLLSFEKRVVLSSMEVEGTVVSLSYSLDGERFFEEKIRQEGTRLDLKNLVCAFLRVEGAKPVSLEEGEGYIGIPDEEFTSLFQTQKGWMGGDGLFTFNLFDNRNDEPDHIRTLCVFGDTFVNTRSSNGIRLDPWLMPHNSYAIIEGAEPKKEATTFHVKQDQKGHFGSYLEPHNPQSFSGTMADNLVAYGEKKRDVYLSSYDPKKPIVLKFRFGKAYPLRQIRVVNYSQPDPFSVGYARRGVKQMSVLAYAHGKLQKEKEVTLRMAEGVMDEQLISLVADADTVEFHIPNENGIGNYGGIGGNEGLFGLSKVYFDTDNSTLIDIEADASSELACSDKNGWFWLQDGIIQNGYFYSLPLVGVSDLTQPEGFQFRIEGVSMLRLPVEKGYPNFDKVEQKATNLHQHYGSIEALYGAGILDSVQEDGYVYIYGYLTDQNHLENGKEMVVARTKDFPNVNEWEFFDGSSFQKDITKAAPLLHHVSCELSVFKNLDQYVAIFTYDVQSPYVAYSLSPTPYGPFGPIRIAYADTSKYCPHEYHYNAKGHKHLSHPGEILASYNVNTSDLGENLQFASCYGPRFVRLQYVRGGKK